MRVFAVAIVLGAALSSGGVPRLAGRKGVKKPSPQLLLFDSAEAEIISRLKSADLDTLSPIQALNLLDELKRLAR